MRPSMKLVPCITLVAAVTVSARLAGAATPSGAVGLDYYRGPSGAETRSALGIGGLGFVVGDVLAGLVGFDDQLVGSGYGLLIGGGVRLGGTAALRLLATRFEAREDYRAWRVKLGPQWSLPQGAALGLFWVHDSNNLTPDTESGAGEFSFPLIPAWTGKLSGSYGRSSEATGYSVSAGALWALAPHLELGGDLGLARNPPAATPGPSGGVLGSILGPGERPAIAPNEPVSAIASLSLRLALP